MVATSQPLAAQAGLFVLRNGGNAMDAALAAAVSLTVLEPTSNGIGGDAFALVWSGGRLHGLNGSGRAPMLCTRDAIGDKFINEMPERGWFPVTVPGAPRAWVDLHERFGRLPLKQIFKPAISYARGGYPLSPITTELWRRGCALFMERVGIEFEPWRQTFMPPGFTPKTGAIWCSEAHAQTLEAIADTSGKAFYEGDIAQAIDRFARETGGLIRGDDLAAHCSNWVNPIHIDYRGFEVWEIPPNTQGIAALEALNVLSGLELPVTRDSEESLHLQIEAMKLGFSDASAHVGDIDNMTVSPHSLLSSSYADSRRALISENAGDASAGKPPVGDTVYLCTADHDGMMVSFIQSNRKGFGSGIVIPGTGIALQNRGYDFTLREGHPNRVAPNKRPFHTIMPGFLTRNGEAVGPFGVMGGYMQPQGHVQLVVNTVDYDMNPQAALDAPRWQWLCGREVQVEHTMPDHLVHALQERGHRVSISADYTGFGRGQIIWRDANGVLAGGSESRADGQVVGY
jgi:gamma-glutamyltranspeptidase/glutathione hydrolase